MMFRAAALSLLSAACVTSYVPSSRHLSYEKMVGYEPNSQVTDHAAIDLDQAAIEFELKKASDEGFANAMSIYKNGANSKSYARVTLETGLSAALSKSDPISGINSEGVQVMGKAMSDFDAGETEIDVQYQTSDFIPHVTCRVGALTIALGAVTEGCLATNGTIAVGKKDSNYTYGYNYTYDILEDNMNGRNLMGFSTNAESKMYSCSNGCPHEEFSKFYKYYGQFDYAHQWIEAAMTGGKTNFDNGNADFGVYGFTGKIEAIKKGITYLSVYMYVLREFEDAIGDCENGCSTCNEDPVHAWDEGVAFYAGSLEGATGEGGKLVYALAEKRCANFKTCGADGGAVEGKSQVNTKLLSLFTEGKNNLQAGKCGEVEPIIDEITKLMAVPLIQGTLRYAYKVDNLEEGEKGAAEGAVFAAAVLPRVHACSSDDAKTIYNNMKVSDTPIVNFVAVKKAFENNYVCMGITCEMVGGLMENEDYYEDASPCGVKDETDSSSEEGGTSGTSDSSAELGGSSGEDESESSSSSTAKSNTFITLLVATVGAIALMCS